MAAFNEHMVQAEHNEEIADILLNPDCTSPTWVTVIAFYSAIQYIEAAFTKTPVGHLEQYYADLRKKKDLKHIPSKHTVMEYIIAGDPKFTSFYNCYRDLRIGSEYFRYLRPGYTYFSNDKFARQCFEDSLQKIKCDLKANNFI
ncbi:MAG: hypothetical protein PHS04_11640 [Tissierellia bacterium]|nr:hypothetical protein [Tissierellia bacterium]